MFILWSSRYLSLSSFPKPHRENNEFLVNCTDRSEKQSLLLPILRSVSVPLPTIDNCCITSQALAIVDCNVQKC